MEEERTGGGGSRISGIEGDEAELKNDEGRMGKEARETKDKTDSKPTTHTSAPPLFHLLHNATLRKRDLVPGDALLPAT